MSTAGRYIRRAVSLQQNESGDRNCNTSLRLATRAIIILNATYWMKFWSNFTWNISFYRNWDNQPPPTFSGSDYGTSTGLGWTFGNR